MPMPWNKDGKLFSAVKASNYYDVKSLLDRGADPNAIDMADRPIMMHATVRGNLQIVEALLKKGANPNIQYEGHTPLMSVSSVELVKLLISHGAKVNAKNSEGWTALMIAASDGDLDVVKVLLEAGADPSVNDHHGRNAIGLARHNRHFNVVEVLEKVNEPVHAPPVKMYHVDQGEPSEKFQLAWHSAGVYLQNLGKNELTWLRADLHLPMAEHLSFRLGNQLFFVFVEAEEYSFVDRKRLFLDVSKEANAVPCLMSMVKEGDGFQPSKPAWGLVHAETNELVDPHNFVSNEPIEMTDWELHDFAVQVVKDQLIKEKKNVFAAQSATNIDPSIWYEEAGENYWVVVRAARYPESEASLPQNIQSIQANCAAKGRAGYFASVGVACAENPDGNLFRGQGMYVSYRGLDAI